MKHQYKQLTPIEAHQAHLDGEQLWFSDNKKDWVLGKLTGINIYPLHPKPFFAVGSHKVPYRHAAIRVPMPDTPPLEDLKAIRRVMGPGKIYQHTLGRVWWMNESNGYWHRNLEGIAPYTDSPEDSELDLDETIELLKGAQ